jgi:hypothetical protein
MRNDVVDQELMFFVNGDPKESDLVGLAVCAVPRPGREIRRVIRRRSMARDGSGRGASTTTCSTSLRDA